MVWEKSWVRSGSCASALIGAALALGCATERETTYYEDVAPLLSENCVSCHRTGGIAPFVLTDYESARSRAASIAEATATRAMPPMPVDNSGDCNRYSNARWLSQREIDTLKKWADADAPAGDPNTPQKAPHVEPVLENPDVTIEMAEEYTPNGENGHDDYRCFVLPAPVDESQFLTAFQVIPGEDRVVHHVIVYQPYTEEQEEAALLLDDAEPGPGYTCFGSPRIEASPFALWAPGAGRMDMPAGTGVQLAANRALVMQVHYNHENGAFPDRTSVGLKFADASVIPGIYLDITNTDMVLPPGLEHVEASKHHSFEETPLAFKAHGAMPHMHTLGRTMQVYAETDAGTQCLVDVDRWDFHWQNAWWYEQPLELEDVRSLFITCGFDTRTRTETVTWGDSTRDEMCISYFYVTVQDAPTPEYSCTNSNNPLFGSCLATLLDGCYEPDVTGTCSVSQSPPTLSWSDGSKLVQSGDDAGFYGPGDEEPCVGIRVDGEQVVLERGDDELLFTQSQDGLWVRCSDGSEVVGTRFDLDEFAVCTGLACLSP